MTKQVRVKLSYAGRSDTDVVTQGVGVVDGMTNNPKLVNPPINPADLKTEVWDICQPDRSCGPWW